MRHYMEKKCRSPICWNEVGERRILGPEIVQETEEKVRVIRERLRTAQSRQKSYADNKRRKLEFEVGGLVYLKVSPMKRIKRFGMNKKLSPRYIGPFPICEKIGEVAYRLKLPESLEGIHNVFHVSMLRKCVREPKENVEIPATSLQEDLTDEEYPTHILDTKERKIRHKVIRFLKIKWSNHSKDVATWELEEDMKKSYSNLLQN